MARFRNAHTSIRGGTGVAVALSALAWISLAVAFAMDEFVATLIFLVLGLTAPFVALFTLIVERRLSALIALLVTLVAPVATWIYISRLPAT